MYIMYYKYVFYFCECKAEFSAAITPVSRDPSEIILIYFLKTFIIT